MILAPADAVGTVVEIVLLGLFAFTLLMAAATVIVRFINEVRGRGYP